MSKEADPKKSNDISRLYLVEDKVTLVSGDIPETMTSVAESLGKHRAEVLGIDDSEQVGRIISSYETMIRKLIRKNIIKREGFGHHHNIRKRDAITAEYAWRFFEKEGRRTAGGYYRLGSHLGANGGVPDEEKRKIALELRIDLRRS